MKVKQCSSCTYVGPIYKNITIDGLQHKLCKNCALKHSAKIGKLSKKYNNIIKPISNKRKKQNSKYLIKRKEFLTKDSNKFCPVTGKKTTEIHHTNGRENDRLLNDIYWLAVSREGHQWIHNNPQESRDKGWLI